MPTKSSSDSGRAPACCQVGTLSLCSPQQHGLQLMTTTLTFKTIAHSCDLQHCRPQMLISIIQEENYGSIQRRRERGFKGARFGSTQAERSHLPRVPRAGVGGFSIFSMSPLIRLTVSLSVLVFLLQKNPAWPEVNLSASLAISISL